MRTIGNDKFEIVVSAKLDTKSVDDIQSQLNKASEGVKLKVEADNSGIDKVKKSVDDLSNSAKNSSSHLQSLGDMVGKFAGWQIVGDVIHGVMDSMQDMVQQVFELDQSLVELSKVSDLSGEALNSFADQAFSVGEQIGATGKDVIDATTIFAQAGYEAQDALDLGEQAIMLKNVSEAGATAEGSANTLIATMKAFNLEAGDSNHIVDALNEVSNKYAVSVNDLSTAMQKSSASMAAGNNSLEQTFGLVTAGTEILREPGRVANGLSTITARLTAKQDAYIASITGGMGVIDRNTGELRSTYDILKDLAGAWEGLTSVEKQELAETVAGKTQRSLFTALMTNFESAVGATETALNSERSAALENEKRMNSLQGKVQQLQSAWQDFSRNTINSEAVKSLISLGTNLLKLANTDIGRVITAVAAATVALKLFSKALPGEKILSLVGNFQTLSKTILVATTEFQVASTYTNTFKAALLGATAGAKALAVALLTNPFTYVVAGLTAIVTLLQKNKEEADKVSQAQADLAQQNRDEASELTDLKNTYEDLSKKKVKSKEDNEKLSQTLNTLSTKYGISKDALMSEGTERDKAIKKINDEIAARKQAAALAAESSLKVGRGKDKDITEEEKRLVTSRDAVSAEESVKGSTANRYDLEANSISELQKKIQGYITTLQNKNNLSKEEEKDLNNLTVLYSDLTAKTDTLKGAYSQAYSNLQEGIPITTDEANALYQLGYITEEQAMGIQCYNEQIANRTNLTEEEKAAIYEKTMAEKDSNSAIEEATTLADQYNSALSGNIEQMTNYGDNMSILQTAQEELANSNSITAETFNQITQNGLIDYLDIVDGKLKVNTNAFYNSTDSIKENAIANLQASTYEQIRAVVLQDVATQQGQVSNTASAAQGAVSALGSYAATMGQKMLQAAGDTAKLNEQLKQIPGVPTTGYTPSEDTTKKVQAIVDEATKEKAVIDAWKPSTSTRDKKSSGGGGGSKHRSSGGSGSKKSGSTAKKSASETYKAEVDALYSYKNALDIAKDSVDRLNDALKNTDNFNEQEKYLRQLIDATNNQINKTNELRNAQVNQIQGNIAQLRAQGFAVDYNASKNELYIRNMQHLGDFTGDAAKKVEKLIDKTEDLNKNNRTLDGSVRDLRKDTKDYYEQLAEIPEKKLKKFNDLMKEFQQGRLDQIQNQIDDIQHEMDNDPRLQQLENQIEALQKQNDELDDQKELEEKLLAVEQAKEKLANQRRQKNIQVYREGQGWVWEADVDAIEEAAEELKDAQDDLNDKIKQDQIDQLQAEKDALEKSYQDRIDALQKFLDEQNYLIDKANRTGIETFQKLQNELAKFGLDSAEYLGKASEWLNNYNKSLLELNDTVSNILKSSTVATDGLIYSSDVQNRINQALSGTIPVTTQPGLSLTQVDYDKLKSDSDKQSIYINNIELPNVKDVDDFIEALKDLPRMATTNSSERK